MQQKFRLAIVGAGLITENAHLPAALASEAVVVAAIVDPAIERAESLARRFGIGPDGFSWPSDTSRGRWRGFSRIFMLCQNGHTERGDRN